MYQNSLEYTIENLQTTATNLTAAESRIRDADMAKTMMEFVKLQILNQSGTSMLAQANQLGDLSPSAAGAQLVAVSRNSSSTARSIIKKTSPGLRAPGMFIDFGNFLCCVPYEPGGETHLMFMMAAKKRR